MARRQKSDRSLFMTAPPVLIIVMAGAAMQTKFFPGKSCYAQNALTPHIKRPKPADKMLSLPERLC
jgi:hypothetical protein